MTRPYTLGKRAESQAATRRRIVEAAIDLHGTLGPARTTFSQVAERAGVQRHTLYAHFPDERSLLLACSGHYAECNPMPDPAPWRAIADPAQRLAAGLTAIYAWFAANAAMVAAVLRDIEQHAPTREAFELRHGRVIAEIRAVLAEGLPPGQARLLPVALNFHCWRSLAAEAGLAPEEAAAAMARAVLAQPPEG